MIPIIPVGKGCLLVQTEEPARLRKGLCLMFTWGRQCTNPVATTCDWYLTLYRGHPWGVPAVLDHHLGLGKGAWESLARYVELEDIMYIVNKLFIHSAPSLLCCLCVKHKNKPL